jgi:diamine N-acetyltransferase
VTLRPVDDTNREAVVALAVAPGQERFVDGVADSLRDAAAHPRARPWFRAVYAADTPVGFLMLADGAEPGNEVIPWPYYLWRMLIDGGIRAGVTAARPSVWSSHICVSGLMQTLW